MRGVNRAVHLGVLIFFLCQNVFASEIKVVSDTWCPFNCNPQAKNRGFLVDALTHIFEGKSKQLQKVQYEEVGWSRALLMIQEGDSDVIIGAWDAVEMKGLLRTQEPQALNRNCFYTAQESSWKFSGIDSLAKKKLGIIQSYLYGQELDQYIARAKTNSSQILSLAGADAVLRSFEMLKAKRIDVCVEDELVVKYHKRHGAAAGLRNAGCLKELLPVHVVFANTPKGKQLFQHFEKEWPKFKSSKAFSKIKDFYF